MNWITNQGPSKYYGVESRRRIAREIARIPSGGSIFSADADSSDKLEEAKVNTRNAVDKEVDDAKKAAEA